MTPRPAPHSVRWFLRTFGYGGITLPPLGIFILAERINEAPLIRHEQAHWAQYDHPGQAGAAPQPIAAASASNRRSGRARM